MDTLSSKKTRTTAVIAVVVTAAFLLIVFSFRPTKSNFRGANPKHNETEAPFLTAGQLVNHSDFFYDVFPLDMTREMHRRVLCLRRTLRQEIREMYTLRNATTVSKVKQLGECHRIRQRQKQHEEAKLDPVPDSEIPIVLGDIYTDGLGERVQLLRRAIGSSTSASSLCLVALSRCTRSFPRDLPNPVVPGYSVRMQVIERIG